MSSIIIFKTSGDETMKRLLNDLGDGHDIDCLISSNQIEKYRSLYPKICFIDIQQDGFFEWKSEVFECVTQKTYDRLYVTLTGQTGYHFGNVMQMVRRINSRYSCFYNSKGEELVIPPKQIFRDGFWRVYIMMMNWWYRKRR